MFTQRMYLFFSLKKSQCNCSCFIIIMALCRYRHNVRSIERFGQFDNIRTFGYYVLMVDFSVIGNVMVELPV